MARRSRRRRGWLEELFRPWANGGQFLPLREYDSGREIPGALHRDLMMGEVGTHPPGAYRFVTSPEDRELITGIVFVCPRHGNETCQLQFTGPAAEPGVPSWRWNGLTRKPTLKPSILCTGGCRWHGFLTDGVFKTV